MNNKVVNLLGITLLLGTLCIGTEVKSESLVKQTESSFIKESEAKNDSLPPSVKSAVLEAAAGQTSRAVSYLKIVDSQSKEWSDGCLGLSEPGTVCIQNVVSGWQIEVTDGLRNWTYRTNDSGDLIKLDPAIE